MPEAPYDAAILGAGAAGLVAALRAADLGLRVALIDDAEAQASNLATSSGLFSAAGTRFQQAHAIDDSPARWAEDITRKAQGAVDPIILQTVTTRAKDVPHFFADRLGITVNVATGLEIPGHSAPRLHEAVLHEAHPEGGAGLAALLFQAARQSPHITIIPHSATALIVEHGQVLGAETPSGPIRARHTLLATGGFGANRAMLAKFAPEIMHAVYTGLGPNDGQAHAWGEALGATLSMMDSYQGQGHTLPDGSGRLGPGLTSFGAIVVNNEGHRFADESMGPSEFGAFVLAQPGATAIEIFDHRIHQAALQLSTYRAVHARNLVIEAPTPAALAEAFNLPPETLAETLATWAKTIAGHPDPFARHIALHSLAPPYYAARVTGALAHTQGGLLVDAAARVRHTTGGTIPGLLAAGATAAGISGHGAPGYLPGNGLGHAFALGFTAAETMAAPENT